MNMDQSEHPGPLSLFEHAVHLHGENPDAPLPRDGYPFPDDAVHRNRRIDGPGDPLMRGAAAADLLAEFLADPHSDLDRVEAAFHAVDIPIHSNEHIRSVALRANTDIVRRTGRWLVEHGRDRCATTIGLALRSTRRSPTRPGPRQPLRKWIASPGGPRGSRRTAHCQQPDEEPTRKH